MRRVPRLLVVGCTAALVGSGAAAKNKVLEEANQYTNQAVAAEAAAREAADNQESALRVQGDSELQDGIDEEAAARMSADSSLQAAIDAEAATRAAADSRGIGYSCGDTNNGPSAASPENVGQIGWGGSTARIGALPAGGSGERWYAVSYAADGANYHPHVYLAEGGAYYVFDVYRNASVGARYCSSATRPAQRTDGVVNWEVSPPFTDAECPAGEKPEPGQTILIRVRPLSINATCQSYRLIFVNG